MRRIIPLELVGLKTYDSDLYDEKGKIIYNKGYFNFGIFNGIKL